MALDKNQLSIGIKGLLDQMAADPRQARDKFAIELANLIDSYVKQATVETQINIPISVAPTVVLGTAIGVIK